MSQKGTATELGEQPIGKLLMQYAVPAIIAMTASSLYNMIDSIFIGHGVGAMAISGLAITFPLMNLAAAFGSLVGVGASTLVSVKLGQKDYDTAQLILGNVMSLNVLIGIGFTILTLLFLDPILYFFGASEATISYARDAAGYPQKAMFATIMTVVINTILAPIFIFVFHWGIQGVALATVLAQIIALTWQIKLFCRKNELLRLKKGIYRLRSNLVQNIIGIGLAPFFMNIAACMIVILINKGLKLYDGDLAIGAFGIVNRISFLFVMIVMGLNQGMQPIAGYNYGARQYARVNQVMKITVIAATIVTTTGFLVGELIPELVAKAFTTDQTLIELSVRGLRITVMFFPIIGFQMVTSNFFQSIGMARKAIILSLSRQVMILIPLLLILPLFWGVDGIWFSMPISDLTASVIAAFMLYNQVKQFKRQTMA